MKIQGTRRATSSTAKACWPIRAWGDAMRASVGGFQSRGAPDVHVTAGEAEMSSAVSLSPAIIWQPGACCRPPCPRRSTSCCFLFFPSVVCQVAPVSSNYHRAQVVLGRCLPWTSALPIRHVSLLWRDRRNCDAGSDVTWRNFQRRRAWRMTYYYAGVFH